MKNNNLFLRASFFLGLFSVFASGESQVHYVFMMLDSTYHLRVVLESQVPSQGVPDTTEVLAAANQVSHWRYAHLNDQSHGMVWLAYEPPADPGSILFVSNTTPPVCLLILDIDAMCTGCFQFYDFLGTKRTDVPALGSAYAFAVYRLENTFGLGNSLTEKELSSVAANLPEKVFEARKATLFILKMENQFPSVDDIRFIAYYSFETPGANLTFPSRPASSMLRMDPQYLANGKEIPFSSLIPAWSGQRLLTRQPGQ